MRMRVPERELWRWRLSIACHWMLRCALLRVWLCHSRQLNVYICSGHCMFSGCPFLWSPCPAPNHPALHATPSRNGYSCSCCCCCHGALEQIVLVTIGGWTCLLPCLDRWTECHCSSVAYPAKSLVQMGNARQ